MSTNDKPKKPGIRREAGSDSSPATRTPLEGRALEDAVIARAASALRETSQRIQLRGDTGASDQAIDLALLSPRVAGQLRTATKAFIAEQTASVLNKLFAAAEQKQGWAYRLILDVIGFAEMLRSTPVDAGSRDAPDAALSPLERAVVERLRAWVAEDERNGTDTEGSALDHSDSGRIRIAE